MVLLFLEGSLSFMETWRNVSSSALPHPQRQAFVLVAQAVRTKYHRWDGFNNKHLFLTILEAEKYKIKERADPVSGESTLPGLPMAAFFLLYPYVAESKHSGVLLQVH